MRLLLMIVGKAGPDVLRIRPNHTHHPSVSTQAADGVVAQMAATGQTARMDASARRHPGHAHDQGARGPMTAPAATPQTLAQSRDAGAFARVARRGAVTAVGQARMAVSTVAIRLARVAPSLACMDMPW